MSRKNALILRGKIQGLMAHIPGALCAILKSFYNKINNLLKIL